MSRFFSLVLLFMLAAVNVMARPANKPFVVPTELEYSFMPRQKMIFIDGVIRNKTARALPDIEAQYSKKVKVNNLIFNLPGELCESTSACYRADFNNDGIADYLFVSEKVNNGRFAGRSDLAVYVSESPIKYHITVFECQKLEAEMIGKYCMLIKYDYSDDDTSMIRQVYTFGKNGRMKLHSASAFVFDYGN